MIAHVEQTRGGAGVDQTLVQEILELVRARGLRSGQRLPPIRELAGLFSAKATAVRDALLYAQACGLVRVLPRAGAFVQAAALAAPSGGGVAALGVVVEDNVIHLLEARSVVEADLVQRAALHRRIEDLFPMRQLLDQMAALPVSERPGSHLTLDLRFHGEVARLAGNAVLAAFHADLLDRLLPFFETLPWSSDRCARTDAEHAAIYDALVAGDTDAARHSLMQHCHHSLDVALMRIRRPSRREAI